MVWRHPLSQIVWFQLLRRNQVQRNIALLKIKHFSRFETKYRNIGRFNTWGQMLTYWNFEKFKISSQLLKYWKVQRVSPNIEILKSAICHAPKYWNMETLKSTIFSFNYCIIDTLKSSRHNAKYWKPNVERRKKYWIILCLQQVWGFDTTYEASVTLQ